MSVVRLDDVDGTMVHNMLFEDVVEENLRPMVELNTLYDWYMLALSNVVRPVGSSVAAVAGPRYVSAEKAELNGCVRSLKPTIPSKVAATAMGTAQADST
jgi:hypothetical protein